MITSNTKYLLIKYYEEVNLSEGNITIFQDDRNLWQIIFRNDREYVTLIDDENENGTTVSIKIIESTFSQFDKRYYISVENTFVKSRFYQEPLYSLNKRVWLFTTGKSIVNFPYFELLLLLLYIFFLKKSFIK